MVVSVCVCILQGQHMHLFCSVWCVLHAEQLWAHSCITLPYKYAWEKSIARQFYCANMSQGVLVKTKWQ